MAIFSDERGDPYFGRIILTVVAGLIAVILALMWGMPYYSVWQQGLAGEAELKRAEQNRRIAVEEAKARSESARLLADAEIIRANGAAEANNIIAQGLGGPEGYLRYLWIQSLENNKANVIYVPTEAGLPILEAGRSVK